MSYRIFQLILFLSAGWGMAGCTTAPRSAEQMFAGPTALTATLGTPIDVDLKWKDHASADGGYFVQYSPEANDDYVVIEALPPGSTAYRHPHLLPHTRFVFRVMPYFGPVSEPASVRTGPEGEQQAPTEGELARTNSPALGEKRSIRSAATFAAARPTGLTATLIPPAGVKLDWVDHAADADGYLLEIKPEWEKDFKPSAFLPAHATTLTSYHFPADTKFSFRVRPFFYGKPSNLAGQTTGDDPTMTGGQWIRSDAPPSQPGGAQR